MLPEYTATWPVSSVPLCLITDIKSCFAWLRWLDSDLICELKVRCLRRAMDTQRKISFKHRCTRLLESNSQRGYMEWYADVVMNAQGRGIFSRLRWEVNYPGILEDCVLSHFIQSAVRACCYRGSVIHLDEWLFTFISLKESVCTISFLIEWLRTWKPIESPTAS